MLRVSCVVVTGGVSESHLCGMFFFSVLLKINFSFRKSFCYLELKLKCDFRHRLRGVRCAHTFTHALAHISREWMSPDKYLYYVRLMCVFGLFCSFNAAVAVTRDILRNKINPKKRIDFIFVMRSFRK